MDSSEQKTFIGLNRNQIKYFVILLMVLDHLDHLHNFTPESLHIAARFISRLTGTFMCYFIAEGYRYTRNIKQYVTRLTIFAVISHFAYNFYVTGSIIEFSRSSVITTLLLGLLAIIVADIKELPVITRVLIIMCPWIVSSFCDWRIYGVLFCLIFHLCRDKKKLQWSLYLLVCCMYIFNIDPITLFTKNFDIKFMLYRVGTLLFLPIKEFCYSGNGGSKNKFHQYFFYAFYPIHLILIRIIYQYLGWV